MQGKKNTSCTKKEDLDLVGEEEEEWKKESVVVVKGRFRQVTFKRTIYLRLKLLYNLIF